MNERFERAHDVAARLRANIETVVIGKPDQIPLVLTALACKGHVLARGRARDREDGPGARARRHIEGAVSSRIQCTPDLQPTDVTGL